MARETKIPPNRRATYQALIHTRNGTGPLKELPFGCAVSFRNRNYTVAGFDGEGSDLTVRLVDRLIHTEVSGVMPEELTKTTASPWLK